MAATCEIHPLTPLHLPELVHWWNDVYPLHPMNAPMLEERLFGAGCEGDLLYAARDPQSETLLGVAAGVYPCRQEGVGGLRWLGVTPERLWGDVLPELIDTVGDALAARGARELRLMATPPHYIRPGVDIRETALIARLEALGWRHAATHFNMTCNLKRWSSPGLELIFGIDSLGYRVRRAVPADRQALRNFIEEHWTEGWRDATTLGLMHEPPSVFLAEGPEGLAGFAAYEVDQCLGTFGPTGVLESARGQGLGRRLLWACLDDLRQLGRDECLIGWIGPVGFYQRSCGAVLGPVYWEMALDLESTPARDDATPPIL